MHLKALEVLLRPLLLFIAITSQTAFAQGWMFSGNEGAVPSKVATPVARKNFKDTKVIFFGGHRAGEREMSCWRKGAENSKYGGRVQFEGVKYPIESSSPTQAVNSAEGQAAIRAIVNEINNGPKDRVYVIAGHSSGAALSNRVAELVKNPKQIKLISLDGSAPSAALQKRVESVACYVPEGPVPFNAASMKACGDNQKSLPAQKCGANRTCGHFALVNAKVSPGMTQYRTGAYERADGGRGCVPNLAWMPEVPVTERPTQVGLLNQEDPSAAR